MGAKVNKTLSTHNPRNVINCLFLFFTKWRLAAIPHSQSPTPLIILEESLLEPFQLLIGLTDVGHVDVKTMV
jgi:hypothetical protein